MTNASPETRVTVIGGGLAGCEAAAMLARNGIPVDLYEMKPKTFSPAHKLSDLGELVCSNSLGSDGESTAPGLLKREMRALGSVVLDAADLARVPAGDALGVDREKFAKLITGAIAGIPLIRVIREECRKIPDRGNVIVATGPLTSDDLAADLSKWIGDALYFYDSISPIVTSESIDLSRTFFGSRYREKDDDYLNCPMDKELYVRFVAAIREAEKTPVRDFEVMKCFEACLPVEVLAERGERTLAFGPMRPVGLVDPRTGKRPYAVVQLRRENDPTTLYNLVGFQSRMKWGDQKRVFRMIPGLENAEFVRLGSMHRNTFVNSPELLTAQLNLKRERRIYLAGQITGVEGYVESAAMGQWAGMALAARIHGTEELPPPPHDTAIGALVRAVTTSPLHGHFSPMNVNFGLLPPPTVPVRGKEERRKSAVERAQGSFQIWRKERSYESTLL